MSSHMPRRRPSLQPLNEYVTCGLCRGYLVDATTVVECLHSFCRSCIVQYVKSSNFCPICDVLIHRTNPLRCLRPDHLLQRLVYKIVPGLYKDEMQKRHQFYFPPTTKSQKDKTKCKKFEDYNIIDESDKLSICLQRISPSLQKGTPLSEKDEVRYVSCPAGVSISVLKKFIGIKFDLKPIWQIEFRCTKSFSILENELRLIDVAYIQKWDKNTPITLQYCVFKDVEPIVPSPEVCVILDTDEEEEVEELEKEELIISPKDDVIDPELISVEPEYPVPDLIKPLDLSTPNTPVSLSHNHIDEKVTVSSCDQELVDGAIPESASPLNNIVHSEEAASSHQTESVKVTTCTTNPVTTSTSAFVKRYFSSNSDKTRGKCPSRPGISAFTSHSLIKTKTEKLLKQTKALPNQNLMKVIPVVPFVKNALPTSSISFQLVPCSPAVSSIGQPITFIDASSVCLQKKTLAIPMLNHPVILRPVQPTVQKIAPKRTLSSIMPKTATDTLTTSTTANVTKSMTVSSTGESASPQTEILPVSKELDFLPKPTPKQSNLIISTSSSTVSKSSSIPSTSSTVIYQPHLPPEPQFLKLISSSALTYTSSASRFNHQPSQKSSMGQRELAQSSVPSLKSTSANTNISQAPVVTCLPSLLQSSQFLTRPDSSQLSKLSTKTVSSKQLQVAPPNSNPMTINDSTPISPNCTPPSPHSSELSKSNKSSVTSCSQNLPKLCFGNIADRTVKNDDLHTRDTPNLPSPKPFVIQPKHPELAELAEPLDNGISELYPDATPIKKLKLMCNEIDDTPEHDQESFLRTFATNTHMKVLPSTPLGLGFGNQSSKYMHRKHHIMKSLFKASDAKR